MAYRVMQFIDGQSQFGDSKTVLPVYDPAKGLAVGELGFSSQQQCEQAICAAEQAFSSWSKTSAIKRSQIFYRFKQLLEQQAKQLAAIVSAEHGKTLADAQGSVARGIELVELACSIPAMLKGGHSKDVSHGIDCYTFRQPLGVCAAITPFNFPVMIPLWLSCMAIACGNTVVMKPSEQTPSAPVRLAELFKQAGLPDGVFNIIHGDKQQVETLIADPRVKAVNAVGSTAVAQSIYQSAISQGKRSQTFGGAKNHAVIMPDADLDQVSQALLGAAFGSAGQRCMAISVAVAVGDEIADGLAARMASLVPELRLGNGMDPDIDMGPIVSSSQLDKIKSAIAAGAKSGAKLRVDGREHPAIADLDGYFIGGTVFDNVTENMAIYQEELFGPVLCIVRVSSLAEAIALVNRHRYGNGCAIFTNHGAAAHQFAAEVEVGMVGVNVAIPVPVGFHSFGGWKQSSFGDVMLHAEQSVQFYTKLKTVTERWPEQAFSAADFAMPHH